ncbi:MAG: hypothetical protein JSW50_05610 [Candidatus Latescibacterota bacterium]|nr:MAG: hypothetical protein JSW50_05610 [Candidatus Latescibacterota bacterium]
MRGMPRIALFLFSMVVFLCVSALFWSWIPDDAYISFQYARSLAEGDGLVFNPGERVEGFSNLLWTLLLGLVARMGGSIELAARVLSLAGGLMSLWLILLLLGSRTASSAGRSTGPGPWILPAAMAAAASFFPLAFYSTSGLETTFYLCCLLLGAVCHLTAVRRREPSFNYVSLLAFLIASLSRPEGVAFLVLAMAFTIWSRRRGGSAVLLFASLAAGLLYVAVIVLKQQYFGTVVPNTYFAKPGASIEYTEPLVRGVRYLGRFFGTSGVLLLLPFALTPPRAGENRYAWLYLWCFAIGQLGFIIFVGADVLRFDRFAVPLFPWLLVLAVLGASRLASTARLKWGFITALAVVVCLSGFRAHRAHSKYCEHDWMHARSHRAIGQFIGRMGAAPDKQRAVVANEIGAVRYYSRRPVIDMLGLTDDTISAIRYQSFKTYGIGSSPWSAVSVCRYLLDRNPAYVLLPSSEPLSLDDRTRHRSTMHPLWYAILTEPRMESHYYPSCVFEIHKRKFLYLFVRNDILPETAPTALPQQRCLDARWITAAGRGASDGTTR